MQIIGVYNYSPDPTVFQQTLEWNWGTDLSRKERKRAEAETRELFDNLRIVEVRVEEGDAADWNAVTQEIPDRPKSEWQAPWDEQPVDIDPSRWAFFFHHLDPSRPLLADGAELGLPAPTPRPHYLEDMVYQAP